MNGTLNFSPDWQNFWSKEEIEKELAPTKFLGEGWYMTKTDTLLVAHIGKRKTKEDVSADEDLFIVSCWNRPSIGLAPTNPGDIFNQIVNAPTKVDER